MNLYLASKDNNQKGIQTLFKRGHTEFNRFFKGKYERILQKGEHIKLYNDLLQYNGSGHLNNALYHACIGGNIDLVKLLIEKGAKSFNFALRGACQGGSLELVQLMISKGARNWNEGLYSACRGGQLEVAKLMIELLKTKQIDYEMFIPDSYLYEACKGGSMELIELIIDRGANDWNYGLKGACQGGHIDIARLMIAQGADDWYQGLIGAYIGGNQKIIRLIRSRGNNIECPGYNTLEMYEHYYIMRNYHSKDICNFFWNICFQKKILELIILERQVLPVNKDCEFLIFMRP